MPVWKRGVFCVNRGSVLSEEISPRVEILMQAADRRQFIIIIHYLHGVMLRGGQQLTQVDHLKQNISQRPSLGTAPGWIVAGYVHDLMSNKWS